MVVTKARQNDIVLVAAKLRQTKNTTRYWAICRDDWPQSRDKFLKKSGSNLPQPLTRLFVATLPRRVQGASNFFKHFRQNCRPFCRDVAAPL
jgi:hypothetical protein